MLSIWIGPIDSGTSPIPANLPAGAGTHIVRFG
jgi:hypothetical protein